MKLEQDNKIKTYLVVAIFIMIILISAYIVGDKIINKSTQNINDLEVEDKFNNVLKDSNIITELSLSNEHVSRIYSYVNSDIIDYYLFLNKNNKITSETKAVIVGQNIYKETNRLNFVSSVLIDKKYKEIFGNIDVTNTSLCGAISFDEELNRYSINSYCSLNDKKIYIETFLKNITMEDGNLKVNKYYIFISPNNDESYDLYMDIDADERSLLATDVMISEIASYIDSMNTISYVFVKGDTGSYYLESVV